MGRGSDEMAGITVLVVSEDPLLLDAAEAALEEAGYAVLTAHPAETLGIAHELQPAALVLDGRGPEGGVGLRRRLRALPATAAIPVVVLTDATRIATVVATAVRGQP